MATKSDRKNEYISTNKPPIFNGEDYAYWNARMKTFIEAIDLIVWNAVVNGALVPKQGVNCEEIDKPKSLWIDEKKKKVQLDLKAKDIITTSSTIDKFFIRRCGTLYK